jgi:hypothetical protein
MVQGSQLAASHERSQLFRRDKPGLLSVDRLVPPRNIARHIDSNSHSETRCFLTLERLPRTLSRTPCTVWKIHNTELAKWTS